MSRVLTKADALVAGAILGAPAFIVPFGIVAGCDPRPDSYTQGYEKARDSMEVAIDGVLPLEVRMDTSGGVRLLYIGRVWAPDTTEAR